MSRYVTVRLTLAQAQAASNACDLIRDQLEADGGDRREAALYQRASAALDVSPPSPPAPSSSSDQTRSRR